MAIESYMHPEMEMLVATKTAMMAATSQADKATAWAAYVEHTNRPHPPDMQVEDLAFPGPLGDIPVRRYRPKNLPSPSPCILYFHGGGFMLGDLDSSHTVAWGIAEQVGVSVISVHYRLAPANPYPAAPEDAYAVLNHVVDNAATYDIDAARIATWGDSAGGNLATVVCLMSRDRGGPPLRAQIMVAGCFTDLVDSDSCREHADSVGLTTASMDGFWSLYLGDRRPIAEAYACPLKAEDLSGLPPAQVHIAEIDPLADDGRRYAKRLEEAGVDARLRTARGMIHGFLRARHMGPDTAAEFESDCAFMRKHLQV